jgi:N-acetylglucosaminyldiphosphoundecaprenol N-acetyl-beta-D-mannosaminyltransferase
MPRHDVQQFLLGDVRVDALRLRDLLLLIRKADLTERRMVVLNHNLHSLYLHGEIPAFRDAYRCASSIYIDGMPLIWIGQWAGLPLESAHRITFLDSFEEMLREMSARKLRVFYLGSTPDVLYRGLSILRERYPNLQIAGHHGYFDQAAEANVAVIEQINAYAPHVLFVGMGMPIQELWIARNLQMMRVPAILSSGATMDYVTGDAYRPPKWAGRLGLYGVFRMFSDPARLMRRYLIEPIIIVRRMGLKLMRQRRSAFAGLQGASSDQIWNRESSDDSDLAA